MNWNDDLDLALRELKDEPLPPGATEAVRARVFARLEKPRRPWLSWVWAPALAAGLVLWVVVPREQPPIAPPPVLARAPQAPPLRPPAAVERPPLVKAVSVRRQDGETQFVKLVTDDPDVVILWAMNSVGDAQ